ncbi:1,4-dihydroxy-2-naphthoyl-CoA synthase [Aspergillus lentulus]|uniref:1,4-dihydroxy-2-naphthoyl-CoA synthase n=1 Tax=Aspergillus lentulus TaxID=293939 RepID=A0AAN4PA77_ASPLE|nr:1,4-dihydroxy-2-naphthoyl-CoA synthase [Aspergillus lentulus]
MTDSVLYETSQDGRVAYITLNRPKRFNAIDSSMPQKIRNAVRRANADPMVRCIVLRGAGPGFCGGYDLEIFAEHAARGQTDGSQDISKGYDPLRDYSTMRENTACFAELFYSAKPTIAQIHGASVAGGSDIALCCDLVVMAEDARIGWVVRIGGEKAKRMLFTRDLISGKEAADMGLILKAVPESQLEKAVQLLADRIKDVPANQNWMHKQVINGFVEGQLQNAQKLATVFDGITRNSPEGAEASSSWTTTARSFGRWVLTPLGFAITVYGLNVIAWGGMLFLLLCNAAPAMCHPSCNDLYSSRRIWIEVDSQILNALFCVTGFGLAPWRIRDLYLWYRWRLGLGAGTRRKWFDRLAAIHANWFYQGPGPNGNALLTTTQYNPSKGRSPTPTPRWKLHVVIWGNILNTVFQICLAASRRDQETTPQKQDKSSARAKSTFVRAGTLTGRWKAV